MIVLSPVNNVISDREEMFAGATHRHIWGLTISWLNRLTLYLGLDHFMTKQTDTISEFWPFPDKIDLHYIWAWMSGAWPFHDKTDWHYIWGSTISWQNRLTLCLGIDHFMTKQTDTMSGARPFHDKTDWHYIWGSTISWQNNSHYVWGLTISW